MRVVLTVLLLAPCSAAQQIQLQDEFDRAAAAAADGRDEAAVLSLMRADRYMSGLRDIRVLGEFEDRASAMKEDAGPTARSVWSVLENGSAELSKIAELYANDGWYRAALDVLGLASFGNIRRVRIEAEATARLAFAESYRSKRPVSVYPWFSGGESVSGTADWALREDSVRVSAVGGNSWEGVYLGSVRANPDFLNFVTTVRLKGDGAFGLVFGYVHDLDWHLARVIREGESVTVSIMRRVSDGWKTIRRATTDTSRIGVPVGMGDDLVVDVGLKISWQVGVLHIGKLQFGFDCDHWDSPGVLGFEVDIEDRGRIEFLDVHVGAASGDSPLMCEAPSETEVDKIIDVARRAGEEGLAEVGSISARGAMEALSSSEGSSTQKRMMSKLKIAVEGLDPHFQQLNQAKSKCARDIARVARNLIRKGWHQSASELLRIADNLDPGAAKQAWKMLGDAESGADDLEFWLGDGEEIHGSVGWVVAGQQAESPALGPRDTVAIQSRREVVGSSRIAVEFKIGSDLGKAAMIFGSDSGSSGGDYYLIELEHEADESQVYLWHYRAANGIECLLEVPVYMTRKERADWTRIGVEVSGRRIRAFLDGRLVGEARAVTHDLAGRVGLFVSGNSPHRDPVRFRNLRVTPL